MLSYYFFFLIKKNIGHAMDLISSAGSQLSHQMWNVQSYRGNAESGHWTTREAPIIFLTGPQSVLRLI